MLARVWCHLCELWTTCRARVSHCVTTPPSPVLAATDKVALLIGNMHYLHHKQLQAPIVDVHALGALLRQLDFKVVSLLDLRKAEMQMAVDEFLLLLDKGVYGVTPAQGELGDFMLVESWGVARQDTGAGKSGDVTMSPALCSLSRFALLCRAWL